MVVDQFADEDIDRLFHALADATRRDIVVRAARGEQSVSALARHYPMSTTAIQKHVSVLEAAGLVSKRRRGREQIVTSESDALAAARDAINQLEDLWRRRLEQFGDVLADLTEGGPDG